MELNRTNYEVILLDALEGNLSAADQEEVRLFLSQNPDLQAEFDLLNSLEPSALYSDSEESIDFSYLKKESTSAITQEEYVAALEGDLSSAQQQDFDRKVSTHKELATEYSLFKQTKLIPTQEVFENKDSLKRKKQAKVMPLYVRIAAIAAVFVAILFVAEMAPGTWQLASGGAPLQQAQQPATSNQRLATSNQQPATSDPQPATYSSNSDTKLGLVRCDVKEQKFVIVIASTQLPKLPSSQIASSQAPKLPASQLPLLPSSQAPNIPASQPPFLTPKQWLLTKLKAQLPVEAIALSDTLVNGGAGNMALALMEKTTGITYHDNTDSETGSRGFAIVSKYFAYEKITHP